MTGKELRIGPLIPILCKDEKAAALAESIGYGIEEEGIPFRIFVDTLQFEEGFALAHRSGLGVAVTVANDQIRIYSRMRKDGVPLVALALVGGAYLKMQAKTAGQDAARIVKGKPLSDCLEMR